MNPVTQPNFTATRNYLRDLDSYRDHKEDLLILLTSILAGVSDPRLFNDREFRRQTFASIATVYPFIGLSYLLDNNGHQIGSNYFNDEGLIVKENLAGSDWSNRPYYKQASITDDAILTEPYLTTVDKSLIISAAIKVYDHDRLLGYLVVDLDLAEAMRFLTGDTLRHKAEPYFKVFHFIFGIALFGIVLVLLASASWQMIALVSTDAFYDYANPLRAIIYVILAMAIFDLAKTTFEEEVLTHKDIFRHSAIRRSITRFMSTILVAVSIEALLLMFKGSMGDWHLLQHAAWVMFSAVLLLLALGAYVWMGAKAERRLSDNRRVRAKESLKIKKSV